MKINGLYAATWCEEGRKPIIYLFCRDTNRVKSIVRIDDFKPYFYIDNSEIAKIYNHSDIIYKERCEKRTLMGGKEVTRVYIRTPRSIGVRDRFDTTYESDVLFVSRFLIDKVDECISGDYNVLYLDIETTTKGGFPRWQEPTEQITSVTFNSSYSKKYYTFLLLPPRYEAKDISCDGNILRVYRNEKEMLIDVFDTIEMLDIDIITAWNVGFDIPYLVSRARVLKIYVDRIAFNNIPIRIEEVEESSESKFKNRKEVNINIVGRVVLDLLSAYKKLSLGELPSYSLEFVAQKELGRGKQKERLLDVYKAWLEDPYRVAEYNRNDVELIRAINERVGVVNFYDEIKNMSMLPNINDTMAFSRVIDNIILKKFKDEYVFPKKVYDREKHKVGGGFVREVEQGLYDHVAVYDFNSMYPSIILSFNLGAETIADEGEYDYIINNVRWSTKQKSIASQILEELLEWKKMYRKRLEETVNNPDLYRVYSAKYVASKFLINAVYGVHAYRSFRLYDYRVSDTITYIGREISKSISENLNKTGEYEVIYNDTDSAMVKFKEFNLEEMKKVELLLNTYAEQKINELSGGKAKCVMSIELEKVFEKLMMSSKKHYVGRVCWERGTLVNPAKTTYVGVDIRRNNIPSLLKEMLKEYIQRVFECKGDKEILENFIKTQVVKIEICSDLEAFMTPTKIEKEYKKDLPQKRAADYANKTWKLNFKPGSKFYSLYVNREDTDIIGFDYIERVKGKYEEVINKIKYTEMYIKKTQLLYSIGEERERCLLGKKPKRQKKEKLLV